MPETLSLAHRRNLVLAAIERIEYADARYRESEMDPTADADDRAAARLLKDSAEREFSWQWRNVKALLEEHDA